MNLYAYIRIKERLRGGVWMSLVLSVCFGCGSATSKATGVIVASQAEPPASKKDQALFSAALNEFLQLDKQQNGQPANEVCEKIAGSFEGIEQESHSEAVRLRALYNAGLSYTRCHQDQKAIHYFDRVLERDPKFHYARAQRALSRYRIDWDKDAAIAELKQAVLDAQFQNVAALVDLATIQMERDGSIEDGDCKNDMECAKKNIQRALAIEDNYMPALNQLALYYYKQADRSSGDTGNKRKNQVGGMTGEKGNIQQLELAALVCSQAILKNPKYAPIHNTAGLVQVSLGLITGAVREFSIATQLDPSFFEAWMNCAAVNLSFRGFEQAQVAYQKAIQINPNSYEAHLGLALAFRGQINDANADRQLVLVQSELDTAKKLEPDRADTYYNEGIFIQEYKAKGGDKAKTIASLEEAKKKFQQFIDKATPHHETYEEAIKLANERMQDISDTIQFLTPTPESPAGGEAVQFHPPAS
ncbi:hypothetical protein [Pajaroellobacter abortibovis]|uniref:Tetratricopeptide repeat protein n=1 Tax=Pajaroellobacter abortibovis TaxID=1882918 RepID=A0A1L6MVF2_9BACT|nr:hypothetical protein [Pajaroellobacter abortibovis]APR99520.1 hypothetical protein BCY86_01620 [Pajaroellobacter abortibovis]